MKADESVNFVGFRLMSLKQAQPHRKCGIFCIYAKPRKSRRKDVKKWRQSHLDVKAYSPAHRESATSVLHWSKTGHDTRAKVYMFVVNFPECFPILWPHFLSTVCLKFESRFSSLEYVPGNKKNGGQAGYFTLADSGWSRCDYGLGLTTGLRPKAIQTNRQSYNHPSPTLVMLSVASGLGLSYLDKTRFVLILITLGCLS